MLSDYPVMVDNFVTSDYDGPDIEAINFSWWWSELFRLLLGPSGLNRCTSFASDFQRYCLTSQGSPSVTTNRVGLARVFVYIRVRKLDKFIYRHDPQMSYGFIMCTELPNITKTCPCNILQFSTAVKTKIFR